MKHIIKGLVAASAFATVMTGALANADGHKTGGNSAANAFARISPCIELRLSPPYMCHAPRHAARLSFGHRLMAAPSASGTEFSTL